MELSRAEQMLLQAIQAALRTEQTDWTEVSADEWTALMNLAAQHKLLPFVFEACYACPAAAEWAERERYRKTAKQLTVSQTIKTAEFEALYSGLLQAEVRPLVVKGILCRALYPNGELRQSSDEDLVAAEDFECCREQLQAQGFFLTSSDSNDDELSWSKPGSPLHLELHRTLFGKKSAAAESLEYLFAESDRNTTRYDALGTEVYSLSPHDHLLYLILHAYKHFIRSGFGIRQVCDIGLWAQKYNGEIDWDRLYSQCNEVHVLRFSAAVFQIAQRILPAPLELPKNWSLIRIDPMPLLKDLLCAGIYGSADPTRMHTASVTLNAVSAKHTKRGSNLLKTVFPPKSALQGDYPELKEHGYLLPYVWAKRLFRYTKATGGKNTAETVRLAQDRKELLKYYGIL